MSNIDFYGGVNEIGGNKILVQGTEASFFFDFGMGFSRANKYLSEFLQPRKGNGIIDFVELGLLPCIKGIYREDYLKHVGLSHDDNPAVDGVLISHSHVDHVSYIHHLREDISIYLNEQSFLILKALEDTGATTFSEYLHLKKSFQLAPNEKGDGYKRPKIKIDRDIKIIKPYKAYKIGDFNIRSIPVDHSLPGASGYIAQNEEDTIVYTGDLRFHGRHPELTEKFVKEAKKSNPTVMISEGTRINRHENITELDIEKNALDMVNDVDGLVVVNFPVRDLDRLITFYKVAQDTDRQLVVSLKQAYILNLFAGQGYPEIEDVMIYQPRKGWGLVDEDRYACINNEWVCKPEIDPNQVMRDYKKWERDYLNWDNTIIYKDLQENPKDFIFRCDFFELKELIDIKPEKGVYIKSSTEPFDEQMDIDGQKVKKWLKLFNLDFEKGPFHASGHANGTELLNMIREINPEKLYPVHTDHVESFDVLKEDGINVIHPKLIKTL
jgi:ribonuclease J